MATTTDLVFPESPYKKLCGQLLGNGSFRSGYAHKEDDTRIIKVARRPRHAFQNWIEWWVWQTAPDWIRPYLAPVHGISECGGYLEMERVNFGTICRDNFPDEVRACFRDLHMSNCGVLVGPDGKSRTVISDYGLITLPKWNPRTAIVPTDYDRDLAPCPYTHA